MNNLGAGPETLQDVVAGRHPFADIMRKAERPLIILGQGALTRADGRPLLHSQREPRLTSA